jgi:1,4-alpha-glucan branching enzyme
MNRVYADEPALWERDFVPEGFSWIDANDADNSVLSFLRVAATDGRMLVCVANLTPIPRHEYRLGLPAPGRWEVVLNTDDVRFAGAGVGPTEVWAADEPWHARPCSAELDLPPLGVLWLRPG